jgi:hypothetical protein
MELIVFSTLAVVLVFAAVVLAKLVLADGYGLRPAPRGYDDWSVDGLPSHPYGC